MSHFYRASLALLIGSIIAFRYCPKRAAYRREAALLLTAADVLDSGSDVNSLSRISQRLPVTEFVYLGGSVLRDGSIRINPSFNASYIRNVVRRFEGVSTVLLALSIFDFVDSTSDVAKFVLYAQDIIDAYKVHGFLFVVSEEGRDLRGKEWETLRDMLIATRSLRGSGPDAVIAPFMFTVDNNLTIWDDFETYKPWLYADYAYAKLFSFDVDPEVEIGFPWVNLISDAYAGESQRICQLSLVVSCFNRKKGSTTVRSYRDIVKSGGDPEGSGFFEGYYFNTPKTIRRKTSLVNERNLLGMGLADIRGDLPSSNKSLLWAMISSLMQE
ncbi:hypothetical protein FOL47_003491 [Perkinsus chesapeaki]|uniref:Chitinase n=1 Tax=Perkinsus chesapeaki TaxID=330153 RepID=A0A7J6M7I2_PERCH|nr:hypothetical protein FOL47_003491 [Perkinsus chesapeaki]